MANNTSIAAPWSWQPSTYWDGNDGSWNSFLVQVGTPPQDFRVFPSTAGQETWVLNPEGCTSNDPSDCAYLRGVLPFANGTNSSGFDIPSSSTWDAIGIYTLDAQESQLGYQGNGLYGFDSVVLGNDTGALKQTRQVVATIADKSYYLGQFGLGPKSINFTTFNDQIPCYMSDLASSGKIPSLTFGYTAGAAYRNNAPASLTLGGYDTNRFTPSAVSITMNGDNSRPLQVGLQKILATNVIGGSLNLLPQATFHFIDSTVPHIWLPDAAVDAFVSAFGLTYDNNTDLFLINDTMRSQALQSNPTITFVFGESATAGPSDTQSIELPYAAFDLQASYPFYENATNYFPIRRAANDTQYTIGRTFFQEAYVIADWERSNFTVAQARFDSLDSEHLTPILSVATEEARNSTSGTTTTTSTTLSGGAIGGIVAGAVVLLVLIGLAIWFCMRKRKQRRAPVPTQEPAEDYPNDKKVALPYEHRGSELPSENALSEMPSPPVGKHASEVDGSPARWGKHGVQEMPSPGIGHEGGLRELGGGATERLAEAPGSEGLRYELPGHEVKRPDAR